MVDVELLAYLLAAAVRLSGLDPMPVGQLPPIQQMTASVLQESACPRRSADCTDIAAFFDHARYRILLRDDLDLASSTDNSFLVHELVHVLEHRAKGARFLADCADSLRSEREAYRVQNAYLGERGRLERHGDMLSHMDCAADQPAGAAAIRLERTRRPGDYEALDAFMLDLARRQRERNAPDATR